MASAATRDPWVGTRRIACSVDQRLLLGNMAESTAFALFTTMAFASRRRSLRPVATAIAYAAAATLTALVSSRKMTVAWRKVIIWSRSIAGLLSVDSRLASWV